MNDIDNRIVSLRFDNEGFEKAAEATLNVLDKIDARLGTDFSSKAFDALNKAVEDVDMSSLDEQLTTVSTSFSAFEAFVFGVFSRLGQEAVDLGLSIAKSLSVDQVASGWNKYESILKSQQLIMAAMPELENEELLALMDKLAWYTDETSFNLEDMTSNIQQFISMGIPLDETVNAIIGIANATGAAGGNAEKASIAMTGFSKAIGNGYLRQGQFNKEIKTSGIATEEFRNTLIQTAYEMGRLRKDSAGFYFNTTSPRKGTERNDVTAGTLAEILNKENDDLGEVVFTSDVLVEALGKYSKAVDDIYDMYQEYEGELTTSEILKEYGKDLDQFSLKAFKLSQEATTLSTAIESVFDATSSQWYNIFQLIFGSYEESVDFWTDVADNLNELLVTPVYNVVDLLTEWREATDLYGKTGFEILQEGLMSLWDVVFSIVNPIKKAWADIFEPMTGEKLLEFTKKFRAFIQSLILDEDQQAGLRSVFDIIFAGLKVVIVPLKILVGLGKVAFTVVKSVVDIILDFLGAIRGLGKNTEEDFEGVAGAIDDFSDSTDKLITLKDVTEGIANIFAKISEFITIIFEKISRYIYEYSDVLYAAYTFISTKVSNILKAFFGLFKDNEEPSVAGAFADLASETGESLKNVKSLKDLFQVIKDLASKIFAPVLKVFDEISSVFSGVFSGAIVTINDLWIYITKKTTQLKTTFSNVKTFITDTFTWIGTSIGALNSEGSFSISNFATTTSVALINAFSNVLTFIMDWKTAWANVWANNSLDQGIAEAIDNIKNVWTQFETWIQSKWKSFTSFIQSIGTKLKDFLSLDDFSTETILKFDRLMEIINGVFLSITTGITELTIALGTAKLESALATFLKSLSDPLKAFANEIGGGTDIGGIVLKIASSLILLVVAIEMMTHVDLDGAAKKLGTLAGALGTMLGSIFAISATANKYGNQGLGISRSKDTGFGLSYSNDIAHVGNMLIKLGLAMILVVEAIKILSQIDMQDYDKIMVIISTIGAVLTAIALIVDLVTSKKQSSISIGKGGIQKEGMSSVGKTILAIAASMVIIVGAIALLIKTLTSDMATQNPDIVTEAMWTIGAIFAAMILLGMFIAKQASDATIKDPFENVGTTLLMFAVSIAIIVSTLKSIFKLLVSDEGQEHPEAFLIAFATLAFLIIGMGAMLQQMNKAKLKKESIAGLAVVVAAISVIATVFAALTELIASSPPHAVIAAGALIIALLGFLVLVATNMDKAKFTEPRMRNLRKFAENMLIIFASLAVLAVTMGIMSHSIEKYGGSYALSIVVIAAALGLLVGLAALASKLPKMTDQMKAISVAFLMFSASVLVFGIGVNVLTESLLWMVTSFNDSQEEIKTALENFINLIPTFLKVFMAILDAVLDGLAYAVPRVALTAAQILLEMILQTLTMMQEYIPQILPLIQTLWNLMLPFIKGLLFDLVDLLFDTLQIAIPRIELLISGVLLWLKIELHGVLDWIFDQLEYSVTRIEDILGGEPDGIFTWIMDQLDRLRKWIQDSISGKPDSILTWLHDTLVSSTHLVTDPISEIIGSVEAFFETPEGVEPKGIFTFARDTIDTFIDWLGKPGGAIDRVKAVFRKIFGTETQEDVAMDAIYMIDSIKNGLTDDKELEAMRKTVNEFASKIISWLNEGLSAPKLTEIGKTVLQSVKIGLGDTATLTEITESGANVVQGFINGLNDPTLLVGDYTTSTATVAGAAYHLGQTAIKYLNEGAGVHSPSWLGEIAGKFVDKGFANGILDNMFESNKAAETAGSSAITSLMDGITNTSLDSDALTPTITPVVDMTNVDMASTDISKMLGGTTDIDLNSAISGSKNTASDISATVSTSEKDADVWNQLLTLSKSTNEHVVTISDTTAKGFNTMSPKLDNIARACKYAGDKEISINFTGGLNELIRTLSDKLTVEGKRKSAF